MSKRASLTWLLALVAGIALADTAKPSGQWVQTLTQEALDAGFLSRAMPALASDALRSLACPPVW